MERIATEGLFPQVDRCALAHGVSCSLRCSLTQHIFPGTSPPKTRHWCSEFQFLRERERRVDSLFLFCPLLVLLIFTQCVLGQKAGGVLYGRWTATAGQSQMFSGTWSAETSQRNPNEAQGSWTLVNDAGEVTLEGTWSARKTGSNWHGIWRARTSRGQSFSGSWDAHLSGSMNQSFADLLKRTIEQEVGGFWQSGRYQGNWWLTAFKHKNGSR